MMRVLGVRVLLEIIEKEEIKDGIVIPDNAEKDREYKAIGVGDLVEDLKVGDYVLLAKYTGTEISKDGKNYLIIDEDEILAKVEK